MKRKSFVPPLAYLMVLASLLLICNCHCLHYDGPERPLQEVAVLVQHLPGTFNISYGFTVERIDGKVVKRKDGSCCSEVHLLPGYHKFEVHYSVVEGGQIVYSIGLWETMSWLEEGHVYIVNWEDDDDWRRRFQLEDLGTVEEVAPKMAKQWFSPSHWRKLVENKQKKE